MINHVRNLLLNDHTSAGVEPDFPGEEFVDPQFKKINESKMIQKVRTILYGPKPDRLMINFRLRQFMDILHNKDFDPFVRALDNRITYWPPRNDEFLRDVFRVAVTQHNGDATLHIQGDNVANEGAGKLYQRYNVLVLDSDTVEIRTLTTPIETTTVDFTSTGGLSEVISLPGSELGFMLDSNTGALANSHWVIEAHGRPERSLGDIAVELQESLSTGDELEIFGANPSEPQLTFLNMFRDSKQIDRVLGGLLLGLAYHMSGKIGTDEALIKPATGNTPYEPDVDYWWDPDYFLDQQGLNYGDSVGKWRPRRGGITLLTPPEADMDPPTVENLAGKPYLKFLPGAASTNGSGLRGATTSDYMAYGPDGSFTTFVTNRFDVSNSVVVASLFANGSWNSDGHGIATGASNLNLYLLPGLRASSYNFALPAVWQLLTIQYDAGTGVTRIYYDKTLQHIVENDSGPGVPVTPSQALGIGGGGFPFHTSPDALVKDIAHASRAVTGSELSDMQDYFMERAGL